MTIIIVGGGPAGLSTASLIKTRDVIVFEEHKNVGTPLHCTSLVGKYARDFFTKLIGHKVVENEYNEINFYTPYGVSSLKTRKPIVFKLKRPLLEEKLLDKTLSLGHFVYLNEKVKKISISSITTNKRVVKPDKIVVAEGAVRRLTRSLLGVSLKDEQYIVGLQAIVKVKDIKPHAFYTFFPKHNPYFFYWLVPLGDNEEALMGMGYRLGEHYIGLDKVAEYIRRRTGLRIKLTKTVYGGLIPLTPPLTCCIRNRIYFIGDAASTTKPFTGGGLYGVAYLANHLARELDGSPTRSYHSVFKEFSHRLFIQRVVYRVSARTTGVGIAPYMLGILVENGFIISEEHYDKHDLIIRDALKKAILKPRLLYGILSSLKTLLTT